MDEQSQETVNSELIVKKLNRWLIALVVFMVIYSASMLVIIDQKTETALNMHPVIMIDPTTMQINSEAYTNLIHPVATSTNILNEIFTNAPTPMPMFEQKDSYQVEEFVIINYFYVEAIVVEVLPNDKYKLMYKDHNHVLQFPIIPKSLLLAPTVYNVVNPVSLLVD